MKKLISLLLALTLALLPMTAVSAEAELPTREGNAVGMDISGFETTDFDGNTVTGDIFSQNTLTVVNLWATWCGPCRAEIPYFQQLHEAYSATPENDVMMLGALLLVNGSSIAGARPILANAGADYPEVVQCDTFIDVLMTTADSSGAVGIPQTIIVDRNGVIRDHIVGSFSSYNQLAAWVADWLETLSAEEPPAPVLVGDANQNGSIDVGDALTILRMAMGLMPVNDIALVDMNGNGSVDAGDAVTVLRIAMGIAQ